MRNQLPVLSNLGCLLLGGCASPPSSTDPATLSTVGDTGAQLFEGLGDYHREFTTALKPES